MDLVTMLRHFKLRFYSDLSRSVMSNSNSTSPSLGMWSFVVARIFRGKGPASRQLSAVGRGGGGEIHSQKKSPQDVPSW